AQGVHVRVRADAGIAEEVPRPADVVARLEDGVRPIRTARLQMVAGADAGDPGADDQHVEVLWLHTRLRPLLIHEDCSRGSTARSTGLRRVALCAMARCMATIHAKRFPGESEQYRQARDELLRAELDLRRRVEEVAALRRRLPRGGTAARLAKATAPVVGEERLQPGLPRRGARRGPESDAQRLRPPLRRDPSLLGVRGAVRAERAGSEPAPPRYDAVAVEPARR